MGELLKLLTLISFHNLLQVGWQPAFDEPDVWWQKLINVIHPLSVVLLIFVGYIIQYAACFRRDRAGEGFVSFFHFFSQTLKFHEFLLTITC